jgi:replicative DNA helicase
MIRDYKAPHSLETEKTLLGSFLAYPTEFIMHVDKTVPNLFYGHKNKTLCQIFTHIYSVSLNPQECYTDPTTVFGVIEQNQSWLDTIPNIEELLELVQFAGSIEDIPSWLALLGQLFEIRQVLNVCYDLVLESQKLEIQSADVFLQQVEKVFLELALKKQQKGLVSGSMVLERTMNQLQTLLQQREEDGYKTDFISGLDTGYSDLNKYMSGFQKTDLILLAARPAMGKTALALNFVSQALMQSKKVAFFSLEMSGEQLIQRLLSMTSKVKLEKFRSGDFKANDLNALANTVSILFQPTTVVDTRFDNTVKKENTRIIDHLFIDDSPGISLFDITSRCRKMVREHGSLDFIVIDYLQLMSGDKSNRKTDSREKEISQISMGLKNLAKELQCPIMALSQLNREVEKRIDKRPKPSDLRESGSLEQDADVLLFVYRHEVYHPEEIEFENIAEVIVGKNRHGALGTVKLRFDKQFTKFELLAQEDGKDYDY